MKRVLIILVLILAALPAQVRTAQAADATVGSGTPASCTELAFNNALNNVQAGAGGTITFSCGGAKTIIFGAAKTITKDVTIQGASQITLSGGNSVQLFLVNAGAKLTLQSITLTNGTSTTMDGGAIYNSGTLVLENSAIRSSRTDENHSGGAIATQGPLTITGSLLENNTGGNGGALFLRWEAGDAVISSSILRGNHTVNLANGWGGAILVFDGADLVLHASTIEANQAIQGGAIQAGFANSSITIDQGSLISGNTADDSNPNNDFNNSGGGIYSAGALAISDSIVSGNLSFGGGGLYNTGSAAISGTTFSGNSADYGGAIYHAGVSLALTNSTLSGNTAGGGGGVEVSSSGGTLTNVTISGNSGGGIHTGLANITLKNTLLSANPGGSNCAGTYDYSIVSQGYNLSSDASCKQFTQPGDQTNTPAGLGPLAYNGGLTPTHMLLPGSPAIDGGTGSGAPAADQRGRLRPAGSAVDIGAVERQDSEGTFVYLPISVR